MKYSIVIPSYCSEKHLYNCLVAIDSQNESDFEVIVVDCSPHKQVEEICNQFDGVQLIKRVERFNPGEGRNIGVEASNGDYIVFLDADVVVAPNGLNHIKKSAEEGYKIFGAALELNKTENNTFAANIEHYYFNHESQSTRKTQKRNNLSSAFLVIEKNLFLEHGGFSDIARMQDTELTERIKASGTELYLMPSVIGYQIQDSGLSKVLNKIKITGNNLYYIRYEKNGLTNKLMLFVLLPLLMLFKITRINFRNLKYSFSLQMLFIYSPMMYVCGLYWMAGFYKAILSNKGLQKSR